MSTSAERTPERIREEISAERAALVDATHELEAGLEKAKDISAKLAPKLPLLVAGALVVGFVLAGGIGNTVKLMLRRGRERR